MIDPNHITKFDRTDSELLEFWLFCLFVRGKNADVQARKLQQFVDIFGGVSGLRSAAIWKIDDALRIVKAGQYSTLSEAVWVTMQAGAGFLRRALPEDLERVHGVGPKTARFFIAHSRASARVAVLDTHTVRFMGTQVSYPVGKGTPSPRLYARIERDFLAIADAAGVSPADMDLAVWRASREGCAHNWRAYLPDGAISTCNV